MSRRTLPKTRDSISFLYFEHCRIEQDEKSIAIFHSQDRYRIPCASICTLMLGPGTSITHAAIKALAENACEVQWVGADALRFYASQGGFMLASEKPDGLGWRDRGCNQEWFERPSDGRG